MKSFKLKFMAVMLVIVMAFTGCMKMDVGVVIHQDGSAAATIKVSVDKQAFVDIMKQAGEVKDSDIAAMDASMVEQGYTINTVDGKVYYEMSETENIASGNLSKELSGEGIESYATVDTVYMNISAESSATSEIDLKELQQQAQAQGMNLPLDSMEYIFTFEFPQAVVSTNGTIDSSNPNKVTFNIPLTKASTIFATTRNDVTVDTVKATIKKLNAVGKVKIAKLKADKVKKSAKKASATIKLKKVKGASVYQIQYSLKKNFKKSTTVSTKKLTKTVKKLQKGEKYYFRVRAGKENYAGMTVYGDWTKKTVKTKK